MAFSAHTVITSSTFEEIMMKLLMNKQKSNSRPKKKIFFGLFSIKQQHESDKSKTIVKPWGAASWHKYEASMTCKHCNCTVSSFGFDEIELTNAGCWYRNPQIVSDLL